MLNKIKKKSRYIVVLLLLSLGIVGFVNHLGNYTATKAASQYESEMQLHTLQPLPKPVSGNPLKGFVGWYGEAVVANQFPYTMEYIRLPLNLIVVEKNRYDWTALENALEAARLRGNNSVVRFYTDEPAAPGVAVGVNTGIPQYLVDAGHTVVYNNTQYSGLSADHTTPEVIECIMNFVAELAKEYDGDVRIAGIEAGLIGHWGEWHISDGIPDATMYQYLDLIEQYEASFSNTHILLRKGWMLDYNRKVYNVGFHNDLFASSLYGSMAEDLKKVKADQYWQRHPIGGELMPGLQNTVFEDNGYQGSLPYDGWEKSVNDEHTSWLLVRRAQDYQGTELANAIEASNSLGYDFAVESVSYRDRVSENSDIAVSLSILNRGVAPFYYNWPVTLGIFSETDQLMKEEFLTTWDVRTIGSKQTVDFNTVLSHALPSGDQYSIKLKVSNPMENGLPIIFANAEAGTDGWVTLGTFSVGNIEPLDTSDLPLTSNLTEPNGTPPTPANPGETPTTQTNPTNSNGMPTNSANSSGASTNPTNSNAAPANREPTVSLKDDLPTPAIPNAPIVDAIHPTTAFMVRFYDGVFERKADESGLMYWVTGLQNREITAAEVAHFFFISPEMESLKLSNSEYIERLYTVLMGRTADSSGKEYWLNLEETGVSREGMLRQFLYSKEFRDICTEAKLELGVIPDAKEPRDVNPQLTSFLYRMYGIVFERPTDIGGLNFWANQYLSGKMSMADISMELFFSQEAKNKNWTNNEYLQVLFLAFFDRESDQNGRSFWMQELQNGRTYENILSNFANSQEFKDVVKDFGL